VEFALDGISRLQTDYGSHGAMVLITIVQRIDSHLTERIDGGHIRLDATTLRCILLTS